MANTCNLSLYFELIVMALSQTVALFLLYRYVAHNIYFAGLDVELLERASFLR